MIVASVGAKDSFNNKTVRKHFPIFRGPVETEFFNAVKRNNTEAAVNLLKNIKFDITAQESETGNNALHYVLQSGSAELWKRMSRFIERILIRVNPDAVTKALYTQNKRQMKPLDMIADEDYRRAYGKYFEAILPAAAGAGFAVQEATETEEKPQNAEVPTPKTEITEPKPEVTESKTEATNANPEITKPKSEEKVGNEVESINTDGINFDFDAFDETAESAPVNEIKNNSTTSESTPFENVIGAEDAKNILNEYIIKPFKNKKPVLINGLLLYGQGDNGKTMMVNELAKSLNKEIIQAKKAISLLEPSQGSPTPEETEKILDKYMISITLNDLKAVDSVLEYIFSNYKRTGKHTIVFIDEIAKFFSKNTYSNKGYATDFVPDFMQRFDNFAQNGGVLIGTTNDPDYIQPDLLRSNRFPKRVELNFPTKEERKKVIEACCGNKLNLNKEDYEKILKKTAGFSYGDLTTILRLLSADNLKIDYTVLNDTIENYAKEHDFGELSEEGTTSNYDTKFLRRTPVNTTFADVAGLENIKEKFRKTIINRLKPEVRARFKENNRPLISTNFLLYGPPGTGKTFIVKALSGETKIPLYIVDTSSFADKYVGESEKNLRRIFEQLENKFKKTGEYSILFFDEANKVLGKRDAEGSSRDSEYVEQLLQYIDNSYERGIITITATNYKEKMDEAVLSRLGEQEKLNYPDIKTISALITLILNNVKISQNITEADIHNVASRVRGFGSREISQMFTKIIDNHLQNSNEQLTKEDLLNGIAQFALEHELPVINERNRTSAYDKFIKRLEITADDPQSLDDVGGMKDVKEKLLNAVLADTSDTEKNARYRRNHVRPENGILLYGAPGCGKTYIMKALAAHINIPIYEFKLSQFGSKFIHETTENIGKIFAQLENKYKSTGERSILMIDEFEDIAGNRSDNISRSNTEETNAILKEVSEASKNGIIVVAATNHYDSIDAAMKRPGRFVSIEVTPPDFESRVDIIKRTLKIREITRDICRDEKNFEILANASGNISVAALLGVIDQQVMLAITNNKEQLSTEELKQALEAQTKAAKTASSGIFGKGVK